METLSGGVLFGLGIAAVYGIAGLVWYILQVVADWRILSKAGRPGWQSLIPILNICAEYDVCWTGSMGIVYLILLLAAGIIGGLNDAGGFVQTVGRLSGAAGALVHVLQSFKLSRSFGHGIGFGIFLILFGPLARVILGLGRSRYCGRS